VPPPGVLSKASHLGQNVKPPHRDWNFRAALKFMRPVLIHRILIWCADCDAKCLFDATSLPPEEVRENENTERDFPFVQDTVGRVATYHTCVPCLGGSG